VKPRIIVPGGIFFVVALGIYFLSCSGNSSSSRQAPAPPPPGTTPNNAVTTYHNDNARSGQNLNETSLTTAKVNQSSFGKLFVISTDGKVDAQPLYLPNISVSGQTHNLLFVSNEHGSVYAFDADTGAPIWQIST